ncbi:hypothetical protein [Devosia sp. Leaf64]|uniref:hypothetical protein n=1 Tax=Devosia sp. Leaf64 TaxID=1736229 RepID=UPI00071424A6|nr:hypothetical protein [Devosia sp. Leaf64]KQN69940.1 hypothetical protein ASE94_12680 [Devosia sp. Leaf64]
MASPCTVVIDPISVEQRLGELGLTPAILADVAKHYARTVLGMSPDHPSWCTGIAPAGEAVYALRQLTRPLGWTREELRGFALTIHPKGLLAVNVAKGDLNTGNPEHEPTSHSEKGVCTVEALAENQIPFDFLEDAILESDPDSRATWYLLMRVTEKTVKYEFSLPVGLSADRHISKWAERLIFSDISIEDIGKFSSDDQADNAVDIRPIITRKNG